MKKKKNKLKVLATAAAMVLVMGATAGATWALTRTDYKSDFKATFVGNRNVEATIEGASYLSSQAEAIETLTPVTFTKTSTTSKETASFENTVAVVNVNEYAYYDFKVTNNSTSKTYTDLIIEPVFSTENTEVTTSIYYAVGEGEYKVLTEDYLTAHQNESVSVRVVAMVLGDAEDVEFSGNLQLNLFTEVDKPVGYTTDYEYSVVDGVAYRAPVCTTCGTVGTTVAMEEGSYVIATPETAQEILDGNVSNKTIILSEGTYGELSIRPARNNETKIYKDDYINGTLGNEITDLSSLTNVDSYEYVRTIENLKIVGTENAKLTDKIITMSDMSNNNGLSYSAIKYDAVRDLDYAKHYAHFKITNLSFENLNFESPQGAIYIIATAFAANGSYLNGLTVKNCSFKTDIDVPTFSHNVAVQIYAENSAQIFAKNILIKNNTVDGCYAGFRLENFENAIILNNIIKNTEHNAIGLYKAGHDNAYFTGTVIIENNDIQETLGSQKDPNEGEFGERAIRMNGGKDATITIKNNTFKNAVQYYSDTTKKAEILKASDLTNCSFDFKINLYDSVGVENIEKPTGDYSSIVINPAE